MITKSMIFLFLLSSLVIVVVYAHQCAVQLTPLSLTPEQYNGSWFVIARKPPRSRSFVPTNISSSLIRLDIHGDQLDMTEYHMSNNICMPPLTGNWTQNKEGGYDMSVRTEIGQLFNMRIVPIYHEYSGEQNEEMNMVIYGCSEWKKKQCEPGEELVMIMSNSRHPQTVNLFKSAKLIEDTACIDILEFKILETYTSCGDDIVDEDQKLIHAQIDENNEFVDVECKVANIRVKENNISRFFDEPRILTVVAFIDPQLSQEQVAHISCMYDSKEHATCEWIRQNKCFKSELLQNVHGQSISMSSNFTTLAGNNTVVDWSGTVIWENGDEYISIQCLEIDEDGSCARNRIYVWSDEDHMDQPTIYEIYRQLQAVCVDPTDLVFLNTFHECHEMEPSIPIADSDCTSVSKFPLSSEILQGVWYFAADLNAEPKIFLQSATVSFTPNATHKNTLNLKYYAQKEVDSTCMGPGDGWAIVDSINNIINVTVEYRYALVPNFKNTMTFRYQVLYIDNQRAVLYWCYKRDANGTCTQQDVNFMIRSRHFTRNDLTMVLPYLESVCIDKDSLRWFDLHSQCGTEMSASTKLRRDLVTLSHYDVLYILTNVQQPLCRFNELKGVKVDLYDMERAGTWFLMSRYDEMAMDTYAMIGRIFAVSNTSAVLTLRQSAALPGEPLDCFTRVFTIREGRNDTDYFYELYYESTTKNSTTMVFRFVFFNRHVGVVYSCLINRPDGTCDEKAIYVISRHESIDHAELIVLDTTAKSVCVNPSVLYHTSVHDDCVSDYDSLKQALCSNVSPEDSDAEWITFNKSDIISQYGTILYHVVASSDKSALPTALRFDGQTFQKISDDPSGCLSSPVSLEVSARNHLLVRISSQEVVLIHPAGLRDDLRLKEAQQTGLLPCLFPPTVVNVSCSQLQVHACKQVEPLKKAEDLVGEWILYASEPSYVLNQRCMIENLAGEGKQTISCNSESWVGECERETNYDLRVDAWGGYTITPTGKDYILRQPSELFASGNISVTSSRLLLISDDQLIGRRYSLWLRSKDVKLSREDEEELDDFCVWPMSPQLRSMEQGGCLEKA